MEPEEGPFRLVDFDKPITAIVYLNGRPQLFFAANTKGKCLLVFRTSLRLMVVADPTRARQEAMELLGHADIVYSNPNLQNDVSFQRLLRNSTENLFSDLATVPRYAGVQGATGDDNQWFLHDVIELQLTLPLTLSAQSLDSGGYGTAWI